MSEKSRRGKVFTQLLNLFPPGNLVDLGTGHGGFARLAADLGWQVTGVDARSERWPDDPRVTWIESDLRDHRLAPYDVIACLGVFYHLTCDDQLRLLARACGKPLIIDTALDHGKPEHELSDRVVIRGYEGRLYEEPGVTTSSWRNERSFWPTLGSFYRMLDSFGFATILTVEPWIKSHRTFFLALPDYDETPPSHSRRQALH